MKGGEWSDMIYNVIQNYTPLFVAINVVEGIIGLLMFLIPDKKGWQGFLVCLYGGFLFGMIPFYYIFENEIMLLVGGDHSFRNFYVYSPSQNEKDKFTFWYSSV